MPETKRLFIAIDLPDEIKRQLAPPRFRIESCRWTPLEQIHLTLNFLGDTPDEVFNNLRERLASIQADKFSLRLNGSGFFPSARRPNVFWTGLDPSVPLTALKKDLDTELGQLGIKQEDREFVPHITLARFKGRVSAEHTDYLLKTYDFKGKLEFEVEAVHLYSSILSKSGAQHKKEASVSLR